MDAAGNGAAADESSDESADESNATATAADESYRAGAGAAMLLVSKKRSPGGNSRHLFARVKSMIRNTPPKGTAGFGLDFVSGNKRSPSPPASISAAVCGRGPNIMSFIRFSFRTLEVRFEQA